jgi:hypothetical protein
MDSGLTPHLAHIITDDACILSLIAGVRTDTPIIAFASRNRRNWFRACAYCEKSAEHKSKQTQPQGLPSWDPRETRHREYLLWGMMVNLLPAKPEYTGGYPGRSGMGSVFR